MSYLKLGAGIGVLLAVIAAYFVVDHRGYARAAAAYQKKIDASIAAAHDQDAAALRDAVRQAQADTQAADHRDQVAQAKDADYVQETAALPAAVRDARRATAADVQRLQR